MNYTHRILSLSLLTWCLLAGSALAESRIPDGIKKSDTLSPADVAMVRDYVVNQVAKLADANPDVQKTGRDNLIADSKVGGNPAAPGYLDVYAKELDAAVASAKIFGNPNVRARLGAAIVVARVAEEAKNARLQPTTLLILADKSDAVVIWGLKAAKPILPDSLKLNQGGPLVAAIVGLVGKPHPSGVILGSIYDALSVIDGGGQVLPAYKPAAAAMLKVAQARVNEFKAGIPSELTAEEQVALYLTLGKVWGNLIGSSKEQAEVVQLIGDLASLSAQLFQKATPDQRVDIASLLNKLGGAVWAIGATFPKDSPENTALQSSVTLLVKVKGDSQPQQVTAAVAPIFPALQQVFPTFKSPEGVKVATPGPATSATAGTP